MTTSVVVFALMMLAHETMAAPEDRRVLARLEQLETKVEKLTGDTAMGDKPATNEVSDEFLALMQSGDGSGSVHEQGKMMCTGAKKVCDIIVPAAGITAGGCGGLLGTCLVAIGGVLAGFAGPATVSIMELICRPVIGFCFNSIAMAGYAGAVFTSTMCKKRFDERMNCDGNTANGGACRFDNDCASKACGRDGWNTLKCCGGKATGVAKRGGSTFRDYCMLDYPLGIKCLVNGHCASGSCLDGVCNNVGGTPNKDCPKKGLKAGCCCTLLPKFTTGYSCGYCPKGDKYTYPTRCSTSRQCNW